jgi:LacI family transcriptional regulator
MTRVSIKDVAQRAGVSTATVSHVLNDTRFVREETRQKVQEAVDALQYQPSVIARGLATNATQTIGLIVSDITNPFFTAVARGVEDELNQHGYHTIFCNTDEDHGRQDDYLRLLFARHIDGLLIAPAGTRSDELTRMAAANIPIVQLDRAAPGLDSLLVEVDNEGGAYQAINYLISLGHRRIGVVRGLETITTQKARVAGYRRAMADAGLLVDESLIVRAGRRPNNNRSLTPHPDYPMPARLTNLQMTPNAFHGLHELLDLPNRPTAIFVTNNQMTLGVLHALKERNLRCPKDVSVISFDDLDWAPLFSPPLTVVSQPTYELGVIAARQLVRLIRNEPVEPLAPLPVKLLSRESCCAPNDDTTGH